MHWLILTLLSAITLSFTRIFQRIVLKQQTTDSIAFSVVFQLTVSFLSLIYVAVTGTFILPDLSEIVVNLLVMTLLYSLANFLVFKAFKYAQASEVSILVASSAIWSVISAMIILEERITPLNIIGILCIFTGIVVVHYTKKKRRVAKGHLFALLGAVFFGVAFTNDVLILNHFDNVASYMVPAFLFPGLMTLIFRPQSMSNLPQLLTIHSITRIGLCAALYALSVMSIFSAYRSGGMASIISPIQQTNIIFTVFLGYILLKEKDNVKKKTLGALITFIGVLFLL